MGAKTAPHSISLSEVFENVDGGKMLSFNWR